MTLPTLRAQVAFDTAPLAATPTWTTIHEGTTTRRATQVQTRSGRSFELDAFQPATMSVDLDNSDRRFDPLHATGPYFGKLLPRKRCRLQADWGTYLNCTGASGAAAYTADAAALDIVGDIDLRARVAPADWTPSANATLVAKGSLAASQFSYSLGLTTSGALILAWSTNGTIGGIVAATSTAAVAAADGDIRWVRATLDVDDGAGNRVVKFWASTDDTHDHTAVTWTQLGATVTTAGVTSIWSGTAFVTVGALADDTARLTGKVYAAAILSGVGGTVVANPDFTDGNRFSPGATAGTDSAGRTWTVSSPATLVAVTYDLFSGFVDTWPQQFGRYQATAELTATDGFKILSKIDIAGAYEEVVRSDSPAGWWRLGDNTPTTDLCSDSSGGGHDGQYKGGPTRVDSLVAATTDGAVDFDGANDKLELPAETFGTASNNSLPVSFELWIATSMVPAGSSPGAVIMSINIPYGNAGGFLDLFAFYLRADGTVRFQALIGPPGGWNLTTATSAGAVNNGAVHHLVGTVDTDKKARLYIDGTLVATGPAPAFSGYVSPDRALLAAPRINTTGYYKLDGALDEIAFYTTALTDTQVANHYNAGANRWSGDTTGARIGRVLDLAGWPTADRDLDTGRSTMGAYQGADSNTLAIAQEAEATEGGTLWQSPGGKITFRDRHAPIQDWNATTSQATFTDDPAAAAPQPYTTLDLSYDDSLIVNEAEVSWTGGAETSRDQASVDAYTRQAVRIDTALTTAPEARDRGDWLLARYAQPAVRPERVVLRPAADARLWRHCLARKIGDRVTVRRLPQNTGSAIQFDAVIESIAHRIADGRNTWETEFGLSPTAVDRGWLVVDDTAKGLLDTGRLAF